MRSVAIWNVLQEGDMVCADLTKYDSPLAELDKHHIEVEAEAERLSEAEKKKASQQWFPWCQSYPSVSESDLRLKDCACIEGDRILVFRVSVSDDQDWVKKVFVRILYLSLLHLNRIYAFVSA